MKKIEMILNDCKKDIDLKFEETRREEKNKITRKYFKIGERVMKYIDKNKILYGEIVEIDSQSNIAIMVDKEGLWSVNKKLYLFPAEEIEKETQQEPLCNLEKVLKQKIGSIIKERNITKTEDIDIEQIKNLIGNIVTYKNSDDSYTKKFEIDGKHFLMSETEVFNVLRYIEENRSKFKAETLTEDK